MNEIQLKIQRVVTNWFKALNKGLVKSLENDPELIGLIKPYKTIEETGVLIHYGDNGSVAFDGEILSAFSYGSEFGFCDDLASSIRTVLYQGDYEDYGFGVWNHESYELEG